MLLLLLLYLSLSLSLSFAPRVIHWASYADAFSNATHYQRGRPTGGGPQSEHVLNISISIGWPTLDSWMGSYISPLPTTSNYEYLWMMIGCSRRCRWNKSLLQMFIFFGAGTPKEHVKPFSSHIACTIARKRQQSRTKCALGRGSVNGVSLSEGVLGTDALQTKPAHWHKYEALQRFTWKNEKGHIYGRTQIYIYITVHNPYMYNIYIYLYYVHMNVNAN